MPIALVTGANRGLGFATARALARHGMCVLLGGRDPIRTEAAAAELRTEGLQVGALPLDVTDPDSVAAAAAHATDRHGRLDVLVNNAGVLPEATDTRDHAFADAAMFRRTYETNVFGTVAVTDAFLPLLHRSVMGRIVNVSSTMGSLQDQCDPNSPYYGMILPAYQSSKAALNAVTVALAKKLAGTPITVTSVCPGWVQTDLAPGNRERAPLTPDEAARIVVTAATLAADARSGTFIDSAGVVAW
jgi:NAD(P)-dependent dehydrogenase (short-subunit alcohol dehydrogenase family)